MMNDLTVCVVGLGYIGLPTAAVIASRGVNVVGLDVAKDVVDTVNAGSIHIVEPGLEDMVAQVVAAGNLRATVVPVPADAFLIAVPTPFKNDHAPDLRYIESASRAIAPVLKRGDIVILESTSPVGATQTMAGWLADARPDLRVAGPGVESPDIAIAYCPERVLPGNVLHELVANDRVIGGLTPVCSERASAVYRLFVHGALIATDSRTAEMCKLTENSFRDVNIAFANELSVICDKLDVNVWELIALANRHPRVNILMPGPGVGGHCIAVDPWFIIDSCPDDARLIHQARIVNDEKPEWVLAKVRDAVAASGKARPTIACLGLAFKANIDDLRESPAVAICKALVETHAAELLAVEPHIETLPGSLAGGMQLVDVEAALDRADIMLILVDHQQFRDLGAEPFKRAQVIDTRGLLWSPR